VIAVLRDAALVIVALGAWCIWGWFWPFKRCFRCRGTSKRGVGSTRYGYSRCGKCDGSGEQIRWTAQLLSKATGRPVRGSKEG
jgi:hypothetical protein